MGKKFTDRLMGLLGFEVEDVEEYDDEDEEISFAPQRARMVRNNVVNLHSNQNIKIVVVNATKFEQVQDFATDLKNRRPVLINMEQLDTATARRILDFMSGATYALGGLMRKINPYIFLFAPSNVEIDGQIPGDPDMDSFPPVKG